MLNIENRQRIFFFLFRSKKFILFNAKKDCLVKWLPHSVHTKKIIPYSMAI